MLVGYNGHIIYHVYIKYQKKVIKVKDLPIFEDYKIKSSTWLLYYDDKLTFQGFFSEDNNERLEKLSNIWIKSKKVESTKRK